MASRSRCRRPSTSRGSHEGRSSATTPSASWCPSSKTWSAGKPRGSANCSPPRGWRCNSGTRHELTGSLCDSIPTLSQHELHHHCMARNRRFRNLLFLPTTANTQANPGRGRVALGHVWDRDRRGAGGRRQPHRGWRGTLFLVLAASHRGQPIAVVGAEGGTRTPTPLRAHDPEAEGRRRGRPSRSSHLARNRSIRLRVRRRLLATRTHSRDRRGGEITPSPEIFSKEIAQDMATRKGPQSQRARQNRGSTGLPGSFALRPIVAKNLRGGRRGQGSPWA